MQTTFARLLLEIRKSVDSTPQDFARLAAVERAARAILQVPPNEHFDARALDGLTPEEVLRIDLMLDAVAIQERLRLIRSELRKRIE